jgi:pyrroline-5-carboxylate reductase
MIEKTMTNNRVGIIGTGNMGGAIAQRIIKAKLFGDDEVVLFDMISHKAESLAGELKARAVSSVSDLTSAASVMLIAVKPQNMEECLQQLKGSLRPSHLIISIAAGITTGFIQDSLGGDTTRVVRVMPNTPALVGAGASAICCGTHATEEDIEKTEKIFAALGKVYRVDESLMDAVTAVSGSGPAYLFLFAECLERAALEIGLPEDITAEMVAQTLFGASKLLIESDKTASALRAMVASPGGTTEAALKVLGERKFEDSIVAAVHSALARGRELGGIKKN